MTMKPFSVEVTSSTSSSSHLQRALIRRTLTAFISFPAHKINRMLEQGRTSVVALQRSRDSRRSVTCPSSHTWAEQQNSDVKQAICSRSCAPLYPVRLPFRYRVELTLTGPQCVCYTFWMANLSSISTTPLNPLLRVVMEGTFQRTSLCWCPEMIYVQGPRTDYLKSCI